MKAKYKCRLDTNSIRAMQKALNEYAQALPNRVERAVQILLEKGIRTAKLNTGKYANYIFFDSETAISKNGCTGLMIAWDMEIIEEWLTSASPKWQQVHREKIRPLLLAEFGSGFHADDKNEIQTPGVGQGTMPNNYGHAFDRGGWVWYDMSGVYHKSDGEKPTYPIYNAYIEMLSQVQNAFIEAFN